MRASRFGITRTHSALFRAPRYVERSLTVGAMITALGIALIAGGVVLAGILGVVLASIGTVVVSVALLSVVYDALLKDALLGEIYSAIGIQENLQAVDLLQVAQRDHLDLDDVFTNASNVLSVPLDPETWLRSDWQRLLAQAVNGSTTVTILLPDHDSPHIDVLAARLGVARSQLSEQVAELPDKLGDSWDERGDAIRHSTLSVYLYGTVPAAGLLVTDSAIVIEIPPSLSHTPTDRRTLAFLFGREGSASLVTDFVDDQLFSGDKLAESRIPGFSPSVMRPLKREVSPDPDIPQQVNSSGSSQQEGSS